jgi:hypothetical protein
METKIILALVVVVLLVVGINGMLLVAVRKNRDIKHFQLWQKAIHRARDPWHGEDQDLAELSRLVSNLNPTEENSEDL